MMRGPHLLLAAIAFTLFCDGDGRPQTYEERRYFSRPVPPFTQFDSRDSSEIPYFSSERHNVPSSSGTRTLRENSREGNPYESRAHSVQLSQHRVMTSNGGAAYSNHHQTHQSSNQMDRKRSEETPNWMTGVNLEASRVEGRDSQQFAQRRTTPQDRDSQPIIQDNRRSNSQIRVSQPIVQENRWKDPQDRDSQPLIRGNRRSTPQYRNVSRYQPINPNRSVFRMELHEIPESDYSRSSNDSLLVARRQPPNTPSPTTVIPGRKEEIVFPGPTKEGNKITPGMFAPNVSNLPNCDGGSTFCESTDDYPSDYVMSILKHEGDNFKDFFGVDEADEITQRIDFQDESPLCPSQEQVVYPKVAQNKEDKWLFVVNQEPYKQGVKVEKCLRHESECSLTGGFPLGYKTVCRQKYIYRRMLALNEDGKTHSDMFRLPSCCSCFVKNVGSKSDKR